MCVCNKYYEYKSTNCTQTDRQIDTAPLYMYMLESAYMMNV